MIAINLLPHRGFVTYAKQKKFFYFGLIVLIIIFAVCLYSSARLALLVSALEKKEQELSATLKKPKAQQALNIEDEIILELISINEGLRNIKKITNIFFSKDVTTCENLFFVEKKYQIKCKAKSIKDILGFLQKFQGMHLIKIWSANKAMYFSASYLV